MSVRLTNNGLLIDSFQGKLPQKSPSPKNFK
jgi:hypothetical protein